MDPLFAIGAMLFLLWRWCTEHPLAALVILVLLFLLAREMHVPERAHPPTSCVATRCRSP